MKKLLPFIAMLLIFSCTDNGARDSAHYFTPEGPLAGDSTATTDTTTQIQGDGKTAY